MNSKNNSNNFIRKRFLEAKQRYEQTQIEFATFRDQNKNVSTAYAQTEEERLQNGYQSAFNVYNGLAQQLEQAKIKVQEAMPVFKVLNTVQMPLKKSKPKMSLIFVAMICFGGFMGIGIVFGRVVLKNLKKQYKHV